MYASRFESGQIYRKNYELACGVPPMRPMAGTQSSFFSADGDRNFLSDFPITLKINQPFDQGRGQQLTVAHQQGATAYVHVLCHGHSGGQQLYRQIFYNTLGLRITQV